VTDERYTVVFTGLLSIKKPGEYLYLTMNDMGDGASRRGQPPYELFGREVSFQDLPEQCQRRVLGAYREFWNL
jgi:hypothetical protein